MTRRSASLLGTTIADRYEIVAEINVGGMGAVYRAIQRSLDRSVAIKFIHPALLTSEMSVQRFMAEARVLSRMNHPHVVSVFDFGRTPESEGGHHFLVMEYLSGKDLADALQATPLLPLPRVANIILQVLEGLGEAHHLGITHRDIKPENIILEPKRGGRDHVKLIDFGIAHVESHRHITDAGQVCGTPQYMAPERASGNGGTTADLYSVGVVLFQMLAGELPSIRAERHGHDHIHVRPPDPRNVAPDRRIPDALAEVCIRALEVQPERRFATAQAFYEAIREAIVGTNAAPPTTLSSTPPPPRTDRTSQLPRSRLAPPDPSWLLSETLLAQPKTSTSSEHERMSPQPREPLVGRAAELAWVRELLAAEQPPSAVAFWGRSGVGRTRLVHEVAAIAEHDGTLVVPVMLDPQPFGELGYRALRRIILKLSGRTPAELIDDRAADRWAQSGLRMLFSRSTGPTPTYPTSVRHAAAAALAWAMWRATVRAEHGRVLLVLDDLDRLDGASLLALQDHMRGERVPGVTALVTSEHAKTVLLHGARERALRGLSREDAVRHLGLLREQAILPRSDDDIEPLYVERIAATGGADPYVLPEMLEELIDWQLQALTPGQRRVLQAIAIVGACDIENLGILLRLSGDTREMLAPLIEQKWIQVRGKQVELLHALVGRVAVASAPASAAAQVHKAAAERLRNSRDLLELRAFHAIHGHADFEAFLLLEDVARARAARGDNDGAIAALSAAVGAARVQGMRGETDTASAALSVFGRKLATALVAAARFDEAHGVLDEILDGATPKDATRAAVLDQLATVSELRGRTEDTDRYRNEALEIAERLGDKKLALKLRTALLAGHAPRSKTAEMQSFGMGAPPPAVAAERQRQSVLVVEDDASVRDAIQSVLESEGHQAYAAVNGRDALDVLHRIPRPGLILLDLMMPVMSGWELLETLRADDDLARIPVIVISAVSERNEVNASRVLRKPVEIGTLLQVVEEFCG